jgi:MerR family transcriptional regulator, copper efflux regulator
MAATAARKSELIPIDEVARRFGLRASTIRYYEERGLLNPVSRRAGRRWYGPAELRRLAVIRYWQDAGLMRLDDLAEMLAGRGGTDRWRHKIDEQITSLADRIERMAAAKEFLQHVASHHHTAPDGCPHYETLIWERYSVPQP